MGTKNGLSQGKLGPGGQQRGVSLTERACWQWKCWQISPDPSSQHSWQSWQCGAVKITTETTLYESAKDHCLEIQLLHAFWCAHEAKGSDSSDSLLADYTT